MEQSIEDFTTTIRVNETTNEAFNAINNVRGWWSESILGNANKLNDKFIYRYEDVHTCNIELIEVIPNKKVVWYVVDNYFSFIKNEKEWIGTSIIFEISTVEDKTQIRFTHKGLIPDYECYDICFNAWTNYIKNSLYSLITTGKGEPNLKEE